MARPIPAVPLPRRSGSGPIAFALAASIVTASVFAPSTGAAGTGTAGTGAPAFEITPAEGPAGATIELSGSGCTGPAGVLGEAVVFTLTDHEGQVSSVGSVLVAPDGTFSGTAQIPTEAIPDEYELGATCVQPPETDLVSYPPQTFTVTGPAPPAASTAAPTTPPLPPSIEPYPAYDGQSTCSPTAKPGMLAFRDLLLAEYPNTGDWGITRACSIGGTSEHKEGRAWDWRANQSVAGERAAINDLLGWLLATDSYGNKHAMARRLGIMYIIRNHRIFRMYGSPPGWSTYTGSNPHTDHVHFSLTRAGGNKVTSFWSPQFSPNTDYDLAAFPVAGTYQPLVGDFDGDGRDDVFWYGAGAKADWIWRGKAGRSFRGRPAKVAGTYASPQVGDFDGDGRDDILWYGSGAARDYLWFGRANGRFTGVNVLVRGVYRPLTGDFDGDGRDDIFWYGFGAKADFVWSGRANRTFDGRRTSVRGLYQPLAGDFDDDGRDDVFWYGRGSRADYLWFGKANRTFTGGSANMPYVHEPAAGDFDGDGRDDVLWYGPGSTKDRLWLASPGRSFVAEPVELNGYYEPAFTGDFDGNGFDDMFLYGPGPGAPDYLRWYE